MIRYIPFLSWIRQYSRIAARHDVIAGLTVAVMLIPQSMAYAMLAGLPPVIGLYSSVVPLIVYALLGTSRQLAVGPVAVVSLMTAAAIGQLGITGREEAVTAAVALALMVGVIQVVMGIARAGFLVNFLSHPVISGFTSAAALLIGFSQLKHLLGIEMPQTPGFFELMAATLERIQSLHSPTLLLGAAAILLLVGLKRAFPVFPGALFVVGLATAIVHFFSLDQAGIRIVGDVPAGFPAPGLPSLDLQLFERLLPAAFTIALVGFMESISIAKAIAAKNRYSVIPDQELIALGGANLGSALFGGYAVTGGFSRTAVNDRSGARTGVASIVTAAFIALTLMFLTGAFYALPKAVLAAIILVAVAGLVDVRELRHLWRVNRADAAMLLLTFASTLVFGIEAGILIGVAASLLLFIVRTTRPHYAVLGKLPGTNHYRNLKRFPEAEPLPGVLILRIDASFYFANTAFLKEKLEHLLVDHQPPPRHLILDLSSVNTLDASADEILHAIVEQFAEHGVGISLANIKGPVRDVMQRSGLYDKLGAGRFFFSIAEAVEGLESGPQSRKYHSEASNG